MHYWAGRTLKNEFANTLEDVVNIILKVRKTAINAMLFQFGKLDEVLLKET